MRAARLLLALVALAGCGRPVTSPILTFADPAIKERRLVVFIDGTRNDRDTFTNVRRLYEIVSNRSDPAIITYYDKGVGADYRRVSGAGLGYGFSKNVREAYDFLAHNYRTGDRIYIFGFSRGAFTARVLASLLHHCGLLVDYSEPEEYETARDKIWDVYKDNREDSFLSKLEQLGLPVARPEIEILGLWDTVEALGTFTRSTDPAQHKHKYHDFAIHSNVKRAYQALSLDDTRRYYWPWSLTAEEVKCSSSDKSQRNGRTQPFIEEVWFAGMHSDVGGGYHDSKDLAGISMNWLLSRIAEDGLIGGDESYRVFQDSLGRMHDSLTGFSGSLIGLLGRQDRRVPKGSRIHNSVVERIAAKGLPFHNPSREPGGVYRPALLSNCPIEGLDGQTVSATPQAIAVGLSRCGYLIVK